LPASIFSINNKKYRENGSMKIKKKKGKKEIKK